MTDDEYITIEGTPSDLGGYILDKITFSKEHGLTKCFKCFPVKVEEGEVLPVTLCPKHFAELPDFIKEGLANVD